LISIFQKKWGEIDSTVVRNTMAALKSVGFLIAQNATNLLDKNSIDCGIFEETSEEENLVKPGP